VAAADAHLVSHVATVRVGDIADENDQVGCSGGGKGRGGEGCRGWCALQTRSFEYTLTCCREVPLEGGPTAAGGGGGAADGDAGPDGVALDGAEIRA